MKKAKPLFFILTILITTAIIGLKEWDTLKNLNSYLFGDSMDGIKNYYTSLYQVRWGESYFCFEGMNYPYGEHVLFTDNQPAVTAILQFIHHNVFPVADYGIGILNFLMFFSIILTAVIVFRVFTLLGVTPSLAALYAVGVTFLAPQLGRLGGHYALSYSFVIPLFFYLGIRFVKKPDFRISALIACAVLFTTFLHVYYLGFALIIFSVLFLISFFNRELTKSQNILHYGVQLLLPLVVFQLFMYFTDSVSDRPEYPWSPFFGHFWLEGYFVPVGTPYGHFIASNIPLHQFDWESIAYIGIVPTLFVFLAPIVWIVQSLIRRKIMLTFIENRLAMLFILLAGLAAVLFVFLFGKLSGIPGVYENMGSLRQFRAVGRFNWVFYFGINFFVFTWIFRKVALLRHPLWRYTFITATSLILLYDAYYAYFPRRLHSKTVMDKVNAFHNGESPLPDLSEYDFFIPLPYFHIGSENFYIMLQGEIERLAFTTSYISGLPMSGVIMSRTSKAQAFVNISTINEPYRVPPKFFKGKEDENILLLIENGSELKAGEMVLAESSEEIFKDEKITLARLNTDRYQKNLQKRIDSTIARADSADPSAYYNSFDDKSGKPYFGKASLEIPAVDPESDERKKNRHVLTFDHSFESGDSVIISFWVNLIPDTKPVEALRIFEFDKEGRWRGETEGRFDYKLQLVHRAWGLVEFSYVIQDSGTELRLYCSPNGLNPTPTLIDELVVRKKGSDVKIENDKVVFLNSRIYRNIESNF